MDNMKNGFSTIIKHDNCHDKKIGIILGSNTSASFAPLDAVSVFVKVPGKVCIFDGAGNKYIKTDVTTDFDFLAGGQLGTHAIVLYDDKGVEIDQTEFTLDAHTEITDNTGKYADILDMLYRTMCVYDPKGYHTLDWFGEKKKYFVPWILDHVHTAKGMQYFDDGAKGLVEMLCDAQKEDGMIWSWIFANNDNDHFLSAYGPEGFARELENGYIVGRQPVENHCEYNFVDCMHLVWKSTGDDKWLADHVDHAIKALNYTISKPYRYSPKFQLLVRAFTIDSWDFQANDKYFIDKGLGGGQRFDEEKTKFGVFFGDNHGYCEACEKTAEMLHQLGRTDEANEFTQRAAGIRERLDALVWNGRFFRQREEEDPTVVRDFGVDIDEQMVMSNMYALNRGIKQEQKNAIIAEYKNIRDHLPNRSPGEWYSIYPPYEKDFSHDCGKWQYMNAGVHGHAAGELVRGAYKCGHEDYATDVLDRLYNLGKRTTNEVIMFAYTGGYEEAPPAPTYTEIDISQQANMDILIDATDSQGCNWMLSDAPYDMINLPSGKHEMTGGIPFNIIDRTDNNGKVAAAIGRCAELPDSIEVPVNSKAGAFNLVNCSAGKCDGPLAAIMHIIYEDGTVKETGIYRDKHAANWWYVSFPESPTGGVFWKGYDSGAHGMGMNWVQIKNPLPEKTVKSIKFERTFDDTIYSLLALTLSSAPAYIEAPLESTGGPDNWSGGLIMAGLMEGLVGVENKYLSTAYKKVVISPRWAATEVSEVSVTSRLEGSHGYVSYKLSLEAATDCGSDCDCATDSCGTVSDRDCAADKCGAVSDCDCAADRCGAVSDCDCAADRGGAVSDCDCGRICGVIATSAREATLRVLLPANAEISALKAFMVDGVEVAGAHIEVLENSKYAVAEVSDISGAFTIEIEY